MDLFAEGYLWFKAVHIIAVISWMAGLLYLPRLFVYHCAVTRTSDQSRTFMIMERRLYKAIMTPAMIIVWALGVLLLLLPGVIDWKLHYWIYAKLLLVICLTGFHIYLGTLVKLFASGGKVRSAGFFKAINEVPTIIMIAIVILVVVKPF